MSDEHFSFVNENFNELQSDSSKESLPQNQSNQDSNTTDHSEEDTQPLADELGETTTTEEPTNEEEEDNGVAVLQLSSEETPSHGVTEGKTDEQEYNPFAPSSSPMPKTKNTVAPSFAIAFPGDESNDNGHRPLPRVTSPGHIYESLPTTNELRYATEDEYDLRVSLQYIHNYVCFCNAQQC